MRRWPKINHILLRQAREWVRSTGERQIDLSAWHDDILEAADEEARERSQAAAASAAAFLSRPHNGEACQAAIVRPNSFD
jgi:hypothetical protein